MKCETCKKNIEGIEIFGPIGHEVCFECFLNGEPKPFNSNGDYYDEYDPGEVTKYVEENINRTQMCFACNGTGVRIERTCYKCQGKKALFGTLCGDCNGTGEKEHCCDCRYCIHDTESCDSCDEGIIWRPVYPPIEMSEDYKFAFVGAQ
jgi:hypothetical protein